MSLKYDLFIMPWHELTAKLLKGGNTLEFVSSLNAIPEEKAHFHRSMDFMASLEKMGIRKKGIWSSLLSVFETVSEEVPENDPDYLALADVFSTLFWDWTSSHEATMELDIPNEKTEFVELALNRDTVRKLAGKAVSINLDNLEGMFNERGASNQVMEDFEGFKEFAQDWISCLDEAANHGYGLMIYCYV